MKVALIGTRGIPARYGGFETFVQELSLRLKKRGHEVWVYCRSGYYDKKPREYKGIKLIYLPECKIKALDTLSHTFLSLLHAQRKEYDVILVLNYANSPLLILPRFLRKKMILHMDGLEWKRAKWRGLGTAYLKLAEWLSMKLRIEMITDSKCLKRYYEEKYGRQIHFIPYGAVVQDSQNPEILKRFGLKPKEYFLQITRFEPENNPLLSIQAFEKTETDKVLFLVGGTQYKSSYARKMFSFEDPRVKQPGFIYDQKVLRELLCNCCAYIHGNEVGGTNPALLQAMASGCFVICRDVPFNREVLQDAGVYFQKSVESLRNKLTWTLFHGEEARIKGEKAREIIKRYYDWDSVVGKYLEIFRKRNKRDKRY